MKTAAGASTNCHFYFDVIVSCNTIFYKMVYSRNISNGKRVINLIFLGASAMVNFIGNLFLIPIYGIWGAAIMSVVSYSLCGISFLIYFQHVSKIPYSKILLIQKEDFMLIKKFFSKKSD